MRYAFPTLEERRASPGPSAILARGSHLINACWMNEWLCEWTKQGKSFGLCKAEWWEWLWERCSELWNPPLRAQGSGLMFRTNRCRLNKAFQGKKFHNFPLFLPLATKAVDSDTKLRKRWVDKLHCQGLSVCCCPEATVSVDAFEVIFSLCSWSPLFP